MFILSNLHYGPIYAWASPVIRGMTQAAQAAMQQTALANMMMQQQAMRPPAGPPPRPPAALPSGQPSLPPPMAAVPPGYRVNDQGVAVGLPNPGHENAYFYDLMRRGPGPHMTT